MLQRSGEKLCLAQRAVPEIERKSRLPTRSSRPSIYCVTMSSAAPGLRMSNRDLPHEARRGSGKALLIGGEDSAAAVSICSTTAFW